LFAKVLLEVELTNYSSVVVCDGFFNSCGYKMGESPDIHTLIQQREYDFYTFIREHLEEIDNHVEICNECRERMVGWSSHLPKLRERATVQFPEAKNHQERMGQMRQLTRGQCLPCGCEVTDTAWTLERANAEFYRAFAKILGVEEDKVRRVPDTTLLRDLPLSTESLRRLRDTFWIPSGSSNSAKIRDVEEGDEVSQLPETIGDFIEKLLSLHFGVSYVECSEHWSP
jgi:hypothetical protein